MDGLDQQLRETVAHAYEHAPEVRQRMDTAGITPAAIQTLADLEKIPVRAKDDLVTLQQADPPFGGLLAVPMSEVSHIFFSPGPLYEPHIIGETDVTETMQHALRLAGFGPGDVVLNSLSYHLVPAGSSLDHSLTELGCIVVPGGVGNSDLQLKMMADLHVTGYVGTPSFLMQLIEKAEGMGHDFARDFRLAKILTTAEPLPPTLRQAFTERYGLAVANCYATAELGFLALDTAGQMAMQLLPTPLIQVVDPESGRVVGSGELGEVVVTNFSRGYPLIRIGTGDMAVNVDPRPGESRQEERAIILVGRRGEAVKVRGMFVHPNQLRFAARAFPAVSAVQGVVTRPESRDHFMLRVALTGEAAPEALDESLAQSVQAACRVRVDEVVFVTAEEIPAGAPGMVDERDWS